MSESVEQFTGQRTPENQKKLEEKQKEVAAKAAGEAMQAAAGDAEGVVALLQSRWSDADFTPEQCVFSLALVTINFREGVPAKFGGKEMFDRVCGEARAYVDANKDK